MILYGRYLSPFVRRVAVWLELQERPFEHRPMLVTGEAFDRLRGRINLLGRVPALELEDGAILVDTSSIVDWLEQTAPTWGKRLLPRSGGERRDALQVIGYGNGVVEKGVALTYERHRRPQEHHWPEWQRRIETQIVGGLNWLEAQVPEAGFFGGSRPRGADIVAVCAYDYIENQHPQLLNHPKLHGLSSRANRRKAFRVNHPKTVAD